MAWPDKAYRVALYGDAIAILERTDRGVALVFEPGYRELLPQPVLGQWFLDQDLEKRLRFSSLPTWFANLLPEGWLHSYVAASLPEGADDLAILGELGGDLSGAVTVSPIGEHLETPVRGEVEVLVEPDREPTSDSGLRFSLSGVQPKLSVERSGRVTVPVGGRNGRWILKLPHETLPNLPEVEFAVMTWARACGLPVPDLALVELGEVVGLPTKLRTTTGKAYLCRRFDRGDDGSRIHQEDLAQVLNVRPGDKYAERSGISYVHVGRVLRQIAGPEAALMFVKRIAFDIMCGNGDAHLKNWSLTYPDKRSAVLAPAYDIVSTVLYPNYPADLALSFVGTRKMQSINGEAFREFAKKVGVPVDAAEEAAIETARSARDTLEAVLVDSPLSDDQKRLLRAHVAEMRLAR